MKRRPYPVRPRHGMPWIPKSLGPDCPRGRLGRIYRAELVCTRWFLIEWWMGRKAQRQRAHDVSDRRRASLAENARWRKRSSHGGRIETAIRVQAVLAGYYGDVLAAIDDVRLARALEARR